VNTNPVLIALGVAALSLVACGGDDDTSEGTATAEATTDASADEPNGDDAATITIADFSFDGVSEVAVGTTVVVANTDGARHTWSAVDGSFDSGALGQGDTFEFTFTEPGEFDYFCNFHPSMTGTIVVTG
jgi:plastocyanin